MSSAKYSFELDMSDFDDFSDIITDYRKEAEQAVQDELAKIVDELTMEMAMLAPIDTGFLMTSLLNGAVQEGDFEWGIYPGTAYTWRQEYEHKTKSGFIRRPMNVLDRTFAKRIGEAISSVDL